METEKKRTRFCVSNKCTCVVFISIVVAIVTLCCVTFLLPSIRVHVAVSSDADITWWQKAIVYQIYPRSFQDSDGDGTGDIRGVISRLPYLKELGIGAVWLSPFYKSPMKDFGYDVSDYRQVDPLFGTLDDFEEMVTTAHSLGIKFIVDFVPNHSSDQHVWFQLSKNRTGKYSDYYIWANGTLLPNGTRREPNKWQSTIRGSGSAWEWDDTRQQYYYHAYLKEQPDLNYRNDDLLEEMDNVLRFWLDKGVDGFRIDAIPHLFEVANLSMDVMPGDVELGKAKEKTEDIQVYLLSETDQIGYRFTLNQPEIFDAVKRWRQVLDEYETKDGNVRWLLAEAFGISDADKHRYYDARSTPFFFDLVVIKRICSEINAACIRNIIKRGVNLTDNEWPNFVTGNHDNGRVSDRLGPQFVDAFNMLLLTLPGTPTTYYGEEIGLRNGNYSGRIPKDTFALSSGNFKMSRDPERNPMQWNISKNAGFSSASPEDLWLPITDHTDYLNINVEASVTNDVESKTENSTLSIYKHLAKLRQRPAFLNSHIDLSDQDNDLIVYIRSNASDKYIVIINFGETSSVSIGSGHETGFVEVATRGVLDLLHKDVSMSDVTLNKGDGLVIRLL